ncbi:MAG TPA: FecR domain-containing protein [Terriglobales bacterium]
MKNQEFDRLISKIRDESVSEEVIRSAADRVRETISGSHALDDAGHKLRACADFQSLIPAYLGARLTPARTMLMEDHLHQCVACRHALDRSRLNPAPTAVTRRVAAQARHFPVLQWALAGALAAGIAIGIFAGQAGLLPGQHPTRATVASVEGSAFYVAEDGSRLVPAGYKLSDGDEFRTGKGSRAEVQLGDGSQIEMDERSQLSISRGWRGTTIHLDGGHIIVQAAHHRAAHLYVATDDCLVASKGTVFVVNHGTKGSRVSVLEGAVNVAYGKRNQELQAGGQVTSSGDISRVPIQNELAWSKNSAKYLALLSEFRVLQKQWEAIPGPGLRYQSDLLQYVPVHTAVYAAIPNMGSTLAEAGRIFEDRLQQSPVLRAWWKEQQGLHGPQLQDAISRIETFSNYLGDEVVLAMARNENGQDDPVLLADVRRPGLREFLESQDRQLFSKNGHPVFQFVDDPAHLRPAGNPQPLIYIGNQLMAVTLDPYELQRIAKLAQDRQPGRFRETPFYQNITHSYRDGAGWLFCVDMEQILGDYVHNPRARRPLPPGFDNVQYLNVERRDIGKTETRASITFAPVRKGIPAWLAAPAPMGSLDFVSPEASLAASFVIKDPKTVVDEIFQFAQSTDPGFQQHLAQVESGLGVSIRDDISEPLGGEVTFALDGPILPTPSWKVIVEVYDRGSLQATISKLIDSFNRQARPQDGRLQLGQRQLGSTTYFTIRNDKRPGFEIDYAFVDSYWIIGPSQSLIARAIQNRQAGYVLARSQAFQGQLPTDGYTNFSAIFYHNLGPTLAPLAQQLKATGALNADEQHDLDALGAYSTPGLIYAYGEPDRIIVASTSGFMGLNLDTLLAIGQGNPLVLSHLFGGGVGAGHGSD